MLKLFHKFSGLNSGINRILESLHSAVFMGLIDNEVFQKRDVYPYGDWEGAHQVTEEAGDPVEPWLVGAAAEHLSIGDRVLVVAAGGGKALLHLARRGVQVTGIEFDEDLVNRTLDLLANSEGGRSVKLELADRFTLPGEGPAYEAIFLPRYFFSYMHGREERIRFLQAASARLTEGGIIGADYFLRPEKKSSAGSLAFSLQVPITNLLRTLRGKGGERIENGDHLDPSVPLFHHHFIAEEIKSEFASCDLTITDQGESWFGWTLAQKKSS